MAATVAALEHSMAPDATALESQLRRQVHTVNTASTWLTLAGRWTEWLHELG